MADRLLLSDGTSHLLLIDGTSVLLLSGGSSPGPTPETDTAPYRREYVLNTRRTYRSR